MSFLPIKSWKARCNYSPPILNLKTADTLPCMQADGVTNDDKGSYQGLLQLGLVFRPW